jgi:hypothetical protein
MAGKGWAAATIGKITNPPPATRMAIELHSPVQDELEGYVTENRNTVPLKVVEPNTHVGQVLALCGAGPSLAEHLPKGADHIWACNSALPYLIERGVAVTAGVAIDQTIMTVREWANPPAVPYLLASSVDPELVRHLHKHGCTDLTFFHNYVGFGHTVGVETTQQYEWSVYNETWPPTVMVGQGATVVTRMIHVALWMGFERIDVYGADCAFGPGDVTHANGTKATDAYVNPIYMEGETNGRVYRTRPDMLMCAVDLAKLVKSSDGRVRLIGDTLPVQLQAKPLDYLDLVMRRLAPGELPSAEPAPLALVE